MYEILKAIAAANNWGFFYARRDFANLEDLSEAEAAKPQLFLDPVKIKENENDTNVIESLTYTGTFVLVASSSLDELSYDYRYQTYIKPLIDNQLQTIKDTIRCGYDVKFNHWEYDEIINLFDYGFDGVLLHYRITVSID